MSGNVITTFLLNVSQCITFHQKNIVTATLISEASLKSLYSRLCFKVIKDFASSSNFEVSRKRFHYETGKFEALQKKTFVLQCYLTIPWGVIFRYDKWIDINENKDLFKYLNRFPPSDDWFLYKYINAEVKNNVEKTKEQLSGNERKRETKQYVKYINHNPNWLKTITTEIDKFLIHREYIDFFMQIYMQWSKDDGFTSSFR